MKRCFIASFTVFFLPLTACAQNFEQRGDERLVGNWVCSTPEIIKNDPRTDMEIKISFDAAGRNTVDWKLSTRGTFGEQIKMDLKTENIYRIKGTTMVEKELSTNLIDYSVDGEIITDYRRDEVAKAMGEDAGTISKLQLKFVADGELIIDEATDNVTCKRSN